MSDLFKTIEPIGLSKTKTLSWVEDSCNLSGDCSSGVETGFLSLSLSRKKILWFFILIFAALFILLSKSFLLQITQGDKYFALAENNRIKVNYNKAHRGVFFDRNGKVLVNNLFGFSLSLLPADLPKDESQKKAELANLSGITGIPVEFMTQKLVDSDKRLYSPILIQAGISYDQAMIIKIKEAELPGVQLSADAWRSYPITESMSHILGYIGKIDADEYETLADTYLLDDNIGKNGLEQEYEKILKGENGIKRIEVDALGREKKIVSESQAVAGKNIRLAIDSDLQEKVYAILKEKIPNGRAAVIISNPQTNEILSLVDFPSYDNNLFTGGINSVEYAKLLTNPNNPLFSRSIFGEYPSGSTIKPVMASAALEEKVVTYDTTVNSIGSIYVGQWYFPDWKAGGHGITNVTKAIAQSVNTFFYYVGGGYGDFKGLGLDHIVKYFRMFGLGEKTGIDLPGERRGFVPDAQWKEKAKNEVWYIGDTYHLSIGQGDLLVTPLQVNDFLVAVANGGKLIAPRLALSTITPDGQEEPIPAKLIRQVSVSPENLAIVREGMRQTVTAGSAQSLKTLPVMVAGKTGTAQWSNDKPNHAWFIGFAPYDKPTFAITVLVEEGGEGSSISVPIAGEIMKWEFGGRKQ